MWTPAIWDNIPWTAIEAGKREGWVWHDDFINTPVMSTTATTGLYACYADTGCTILPGATNEYGEVVLTLDADDNQEASIQMHGTTGGNAKFILQATAVPHMIAFECRAKVSTIVGSAFLGFAEEGACGDAGLISDTGTIPDKDCIGFFLPEADPDGWDFVYNKSGGADPTTKIADVDTAVVNTYAKFGFLYNYKNSHSQQIKVFIDGVLNSTYVTKANIDDTTNFPGGEEMAPYFCVKNVTDIKAMTMDWFRVAQVPFA
jgi:hypothetical protein